MEREKERSERERQWLEVKEEEIYAYVFTISLLCNALISRPWFLCYRLQIPFQISFPKDKTLIWTSYKEDRTVHESEDILFVVA